MMLYTLHIDLGLDRAQPEDGNCDVNRNVEFLYPQHLANIQTISNITTQALTQLDVNYHKCITNYLIL